MLTVSYLVYYDTLIQNSIKCDSYLITKYDILQKGLLQNASGVLLQNVIVLLENATVITKCVDFSTKCDSYYKTCWYRQGLKYVSDMFEGNSNSQIWCNVRRGLENAFPKYYYMHFTNYPKSINIIAGLHF